MSITDNSIPTFNVGYRFQYEEAQQSYVLLYPEGMVKFNGSAAEILQRIDGKKSVGDIIKNLEQTFEGVDVRDDVLEFLEDAQNKSWIRCE